MTIAVVKKPSEANVNANIRLSDTNNGIQC